MADIDPVAQARADMQKEVARVRSIVDSVEAHVKTQIAPSQSKLKLFISNYWPIALGLAFALTRFL